MTQITSTTVPQESPPPDERLTGQPRTIPPDIAARNAYILESLNQAAPMLRNFAKRSRRDYDEVWQIAAVAALEQYERAQSVENPRAYLHRVIRNAILKSLHVPPIQFLSLDAPVAQGSEMTYADYLVSPDPVPCDTAREQQQMTALYQALNRLPLEDQVYLCRVHGIIAYTPVLPTEGRFAVKFPDLTRTNNALGTHAYHWLRRDEALVHALYSSEHSASEKRD